MRGIRISILLVIITGLFLSSAPVLAAQSDACPQILRDFQSIPGWRESLTNPVLNDLAQLQIRLRAYLPVYRCLQKPGTQLSSDMQQLRDDLELFLIFGGKLGFPADSRAASAFVSFPQLADPGLNALREEVRLPDPDTGLVYIWFFPSDRDMPERIRRVFQSNANIDGVTFSRRFIAVLSTSPESDASSIRSNSGFNRTITHELLHAFLNTTILRLHVFQTPGTQPQKWYSEGLASYFSQKSPARISTEAGREDTDSYEYRRYRGVFEYLERKYGRQQLMENIRQSLYQGDTELLYAGLGFLDADAIMAQADQERAHMIRTVGIGGSTLLLLVLLALIFREAFFSLLALPFVLVGNVLYAASHRPPDVDRYQRLGDLAGLQRALLYYHRDNLAVTRHVSHQAAQALLALQGPAALEIFLPILNTPDAYHEATLQAVCEAAGSVPDRRLLLPLTALLEKPGLTKFAAHALAQVGGEQALTALLDHIVAADGLVDEDILEILKDWEDWKGRQALLIHRLRTGTPIQREHACILMGELRFIRAIPYLQEYLHSGSGDALAVLQALAKINTPDADMVITNYLNQKDAGFVAEFVHDLADDERPRFSNPLMQAIYRADTPIRIRIADILYRIGGDEERRFLSNLRFFLPDIELQRHIAALFRTYL